MIQLKVPTLAQCREEVEAGRVSERRDGRFAIFNYRAVVQYDDSLWNPVNRACRGLIFDVETEKPVAVPFPKFFNVGQMPETEPERLAGLDVIRVAPKYDGSLGIVWWDYVANRARVVTRGTFNSVQGQAADKMLQLAMYCGGHSLKASLREGYTYLCEIIDTATRVVVAYDFAGLVGLARVSPEHVLDFDLADWPSAWPIVRRAGHTLDSALKLAQSETGTEGWVFTYSDGTMAKVKTDDYKKLHRLVAGVNKRRVWEVLSGGGTLEDEWAGLPDEYMAEAKAWRRELMTAYGQERRAFGTAVFPNKPFGSRKNAALWAKSNLPAKWLAPFFAYLDEKPLPPLFWKLVKPEADSP